jgi:hypothetical protein
MKRIVALGAVGVLLLSAAGCGGPDNLMKEFIANLNAYAETIEKKESQERQQAAADRVNATIEKLDKLKLSEEQYQKLLKKYESELNAATERVKKAQLAQELEGRPGVTPPNPLPGFKPK